MSVGTVGASGSTDPFAGAGVVRAIVMDVDDPTGRGQIRLTYPFLDSEAPSNWASIATPMAGKDRGMFMMPEVGDEAVVLFERGDPSFPIVIGFTYNGMDDTPSTAVRERMIRSFNGHTIRLIDSTPTAGGNRGGIAIEDANGNEIVMTNGKVTIRSMGVLELDAATIIVRSSGVSRLVSPTPNSI